jgi:aspartyl-tRNA(Asn)/glutamyl-tRNA(Gln) amidotransferase subunit A
MPIAVKANIAVAGMPHHAGIAAFRDRIAPHDAACVASLRAQGAIILGLTNMHEAAFGGTTDNPAFGRTENPARPGFTAGGSSGGSAAAVAAGFCAAALGTDTLGSVRIPSAYCGIFGFKPQAGSMPMGGIMPLSPSLDQLGFHTTSLADCARLTTALAGVAATPASLPRHLAILRHDIPLDPAQDAALAQAAARARNAGATTEDVRLPGLDTTRLRRQALLLLEAEAEAFYRAAITANPEGFSLGLRHMFAWAAAQPPARLQAAKDALADFAATLKAAIRPFSAILLPTTAHLAFSWSDPIPADQADFTALASIAGLPALTIPAPGPHGLPAAIQIIAPTHHAAFTLAEALIPAA